jgi:hypothetical protein
MLPSVVPCFNAGRSSTCMNESVHHIRKIDTARFEQGKRRSLCRDWMRVSCEAVSELGTRKSVAALIWSCAVAVAALSFLSSCKKNGLRGSPSRRPCGDNLPNYRSGRTAMAVRAARPANRLIIVLNGKVLAPMFRSPVREVCIFRLRAIPRVNVPSAEPRDRARGRFRSGRLGLPDAAVAEDGARRRTR